MRQKQKASRTITIKVPLGQIEYHQIKSEVADRHMNPLKTIKKETISIGAFLSKKNSVITSDVVTQGLMFLQKHKFETKKLIECKGSSLVLKAYDRKNERGVAIRLIKLQNKQILSDKVKEISNLIEFDHPNIVETYEILQDQDHDTIFVISELCEKGNLLDYKNQNQLTNGQIINIIDRIIDGIIAMHSKEIIHYNLKPTNILIDDYGRFKICNFAFQKNLIDAMTKQQIMQTTMPQTDVSKQSDVYEVGAILLSLCGIDIDINGQNVNSDIIRLSNKHPQSELLNIAFQMTHQNPKQRITLKTSQKQLKELLLMQNIKLSYIEGDYEGEVKDNQMHGFGTFCYKQIFETQKYTGSWMNGKRYGFGIMEYKCGSRYEGEWNHGVFNGQGIYYFESNSNSLKYIGSWMNDKSNGYGIIYFRDGSKYQGEWKDGSFNGQGIFDCGPTSNILKYTGSWINGKKNGYGIQETRDGSKYEGEWKDNFVRGQGTLYLESTNETVKIVGSWTANPTASPNRDDNTIQLSGSGVQENRNGSKYEGEWRDGYRNGKGTYYFEQQNENLTYVGSWSNHQPGGYGVLVKKNGSRYEGSFLDGKLNGKGTFYYETNSDKFKLTGEWFKGVASGYGILQFRNGSTYEGQFKDNQYHGQGTLLKLDGWKYVGYWLNGKRNGHGVEEHSEGSKFEGEWKDDLKYGNGIQYFEPQSQYLKYVGTWMDGHMNGYGILKYRNGQKYKGYWKDGFKHGQGTLSYEPTNQIVKYVGTWMNDTKNGEGSEVYQNGSKYEGDWKDGYFNGQGQFYYESSSKCLKYMGSWINGKKNGYGVEEYRDVSLANRSQTNTLQSDEGAFYTEYLSDGLRYVGQWMNVNKNETEAKAYGNSKYEREWKNGQKHGSGTFYYEQSFEMLKYIGEWRNNKKNGPGVEENINGTQLKGNWKDDVKI